ncbi:hypothetical protein EUX98_g9016 [Antrodiella citrinella]|uniref:Uncharacterized protein n=1 Tax=Antrodiella citrinella TaxID=2447956 RepID=A0A4S4M0Y2_9APHY|nr:hypothetical protein EUX98_g9016 [Antrodiella citrinella]
MQVNEGQNAVLSADSGTAEELRVQVQQLRVANEVLQRQKVDAEKDRELFRDMYSKASAHAGEVIKENNTLEERATLAEGQIREGVTMIKLTYEGRVRKLEEEVKKWRGLYDLLVVKDRRSNGDEVRRKAALEDELESENAKLREEMDLLRDDNEKMEKVLEQLGEQDLAQFDEQEEEMKHTMGNEQGTTGVIKSSIAISLNVFQHMSHQHRLNGGAYSSRRHRGWEHIGPAHHRIRDPVHIPPHLIYLPDRALLAIQENLSLPEALTLFGISTSLYRWKGLAFKKLIFDINDTDQAGLIRTANNLHNLSQVLRHFTRYGEAVEAISIRDGGSPLFMGFNRADSIVNSILRSTPNLVVFQWFADIVVRPNPPTLTVATLRRLSRLRDLRLEGFDSPNPTQFRAVMTDLSREQPYLQNLQRAVIRCGGHPEYWFYAFLRNAPALQALDFANKQHSSVHDSLAQYAHGWQRLEILVLSSMPAALGSYIGLMGQGLSNGAWRNLTSFSLDNRVDREQLQRIVRLLHGTCQLQRFRLVVNAYNNYYIQGFGPVFVREMLQFLPHLEELILDQYNTTTFTPLPGTWEEWGTQLRTAPSLRILTLPVFFVIDDMRVQHLELHSELAVFAEEFIDTHLRKPSFEELRFLNTVTAPDRYAFITGTVRAVQERMMRTQQQQQHRGPLYMFKGYKVLRFIQKVDRDAEREGERGRYIVEYLMQQTEEKEAEMLFWKPRTRIVAV